MISIIFAIYNGERNQCIINILPSILIKHQRIIFNYRQNKQLDYFMLDNYTAE